MSWLEITRNCNLKCDYCCQCHDPNSEKSISTIQSELKTLLWMRSCDTVIIAGGEPLLHPDIVQITQLVAAHNVKPIILTNGVLLTRELAQKLKKAGLFGFTFHVDSKQGRPGWVGRSERDNNQLRQHFADLVHRVGGLHCAFNTVVFPDTLGEMSHVVDWAKQNMDRVHVMMMIAVRTTSADDPWDYFVDGKRIEIGTSAYATKIHQQDLESIDLYNEVQKVYPGYQFNSYLGGTRRQDALKWVMGNHIGTKSQYFGNLGAASVKRLQSMNYRRKGRYFAHISPLINRMAAVTLLLCFFDKAVRRSFLNYFFSIIKNPKTIFRRLRLQTIILMQPMDFLGEGGQDNCDGCPNMTLFDGKLIRGCEVESYIQYGAGFETKPKSLLPKTVPNMKIPLIHNLTKNVAEAQR